MTDFQCQSCGSCCRWPGIVVPTDAEIEQAAAFLHLDIYDFIEQYTVLSPDRTRLLYKDAPGGECIFLTPDNRCRIYPARPGQCRNFPHTWDVPPEYQKCCAGRRKQRQDAERPFRMLHVLGHPAKPLDVTAAPADAQVLNCQNLCLILEALKLPYTYYGVPGSRLPSPSAHFVSTGKPTGRWFYRSAWHTLYNRRLTRQLEKNVRTEGEDDLILSLYGAAQSDIRSFGLPVIEPMVGYDHCWAPYRIFPSYAHQHTLYATQPERTRDTRFFDTVLPHLLPLDAYTPGEPADETSEAPYLLYLGRNAPDKGIELARHAAEAAGLPLRCIHDGLFGPAKTALLARARAVFMPTCYVEPFGYVAVEAQLCGTPVITTDWGAFAETVRHGVTGFRCRSHAEFVYATQAVTRLDRHAIRADAIERFTIEKRASEYLDYFRFVRTVHYHGGYAAYAAVRSRTDFPPLP